MKMDLRKIKKHIISEMDEAEMSEQDDRRTGLSFILDDVLGLIDELRQGFTKINTLDLESEIERINDALAQNQIESLTRQEIELQAMKNIEQKQLTMYWQLIMDALGEGTA